MHEVSGKFFATLDRVLEAHRISGDVLVAGLGVSFEELSTRDRRFAWDLLVELCDRLATRIGLDAMEEVEDAVPDEFVSIVTAVGASSGPGEAFAMLAWVPAYLFGVPRFQHRVIDSAVELTVEIPPERRGSAAWLRLFLARCRRLGGLLGTRVDVPIEVLSPHHARLRLPFAEDAAGAGVARTGGATTSQMIASLRLGAEALARVEREREAGSTERAREAAVNRSLLDALDEGVAIVDAATLRVTWCNPAWTRILGVTAAHEPASTLLDQLDHPCGERLRQALAPGGEPPGTVDAVLGSEVEVELTFSDRREAPEIGGWIVSARDVTARNAARRDALRREHEHALLLQNLRGMGYRCRNDASWTMELVTEGCAQVTGYEVDALLLNRQVAFGDLVHPDDAGPLWEKCQRNLEARRPCVNEYRIRSRAGDWKWVLDIAHGVYGRNGELVAIEGFVTDVDERHRLEEQLHHAMRLESLGRLAAGVAHDFNNYLTAILGLAGMLRTEVRPGSQGAEDLASLEDATRKAAGLTRQMLAFARKQPVRPCIVDVNAVLESNRRLFQQTVGPAVDLSITLAPQLDPVEVDPVQLEQVLFNLANNARDAMPDGGVLRIETRHRGDDGEPRAVEEGEAAWVSISFADSGVGMSPEVVARVFEPFFSTKESGNGLGLATSHGIIRQAGGRLDVASRPGAGTVFEILLPARHGAVPQARAEGQRSGA